MSTPTPQSPHLISSVPARAWTLLCLGLLFLTPFASATVPEIDECKGALVPSVSSGCGDVEYVGCCDVQGRLLWCEGNKLYCIDCAGEFPSCGWNHLGYYDCGATAGTEDPTGVHSATCDLCPSECVDGSPCSPTCSSGCGNCAPGAICQDDGSCYAPACDGKSCGVDPQGFSCGVCPSGMECMVEQGQCVPLPAGCTPSQNAGCDGCPCEACVCEKYPTCCTDHWDQFCASACELDCEFSCSACTETADCTGKECGTYCGVNCGNCPPEQVCFGNQCCAPDCGGKTCGSDGCGGNCGACNGGESCQNGQCDVCTPECEGKACGDDGCGGLCGTCTAGGYCEGNSCEESLCKGACSEGPFPVPGGGKCYCDGTCFFYHDCCEGLCESCPKEGACCTPQCDGKECGENGCDGVCGSCSGGYTCENYNCVPCAPQCDGKECGDDACGGDCGDCGNGWECNDFQCIECEPKCDGKECGDDGCGGSCGDCGNEAICQGSTCVICEPQCEGKVCGNNGCGGTCGNCVGAQQCIAGKCIGIADPCQGVGFQGCCDGNKNIWCADANLYDKDCASEGKLCGWVAEYQYYGCEDTGEAEPTGIFPPVCPFVCSPSCTGKECGDDGCDGVCGVCNVDLTCTENQCVPREGGPVQSPEGGEESTESEEEGGTGTNRPSSGGCKNTNAPTQGLFTVLFLLLFAWKRQGNRAPS